LPTVYQGKTLALLRLHFAKRLLPKLKKTMQMTPARLRAALLKELKSEFAEGTNGEVGRLEAVELGAIIEEQTPRVRGTALRG